MIHTRHLNWSESHDQVVCGLDEENHGTPTLTVIDRLFSFPVNPRCCNKHVPQTFSIVFSTLHLVAL